MLMWKDPVASLSSFDPDQRAGALQSVRQLLEGPDKKVSKTAEWHAERFLVLRDRETVLFEGLSEAATAGPEGVLGDVGYCFFLYGQRCNDFSTVWQWVLERTVSRTPFQRLRIFVGIIRRILDAKASDIALQGHACRIVNSLLKVLESTRRNELLPEIVSVFSIVAARAPAEFSTSFQDAVDLLLGWATDVDLPDKYRDLISESFESFQLQWCAVEHRPFALSLQRKLLADMRKMATSLLQAGESDTLHALLYCFHGISKAMGNLGEIYENTAPVIIQCIRFYMGYVAKEPRQAVCNLRTCVYVHLVALRKAGPTINTNVVREVLQSEAFHCLRVFLDADLRRLLLQTYLEFALSCGDAVQTLLFEIFGKEFPRSIAVQGLETGEGDGLQAAMERETSAIPRHMAIFGARELQAVSAFNFIVLQHLPQALPLLREMLGSFPEQRGMLLVHIWDAAGRALRAGNLCDIEELLPDVCQVLATDEGEVLLRSICSSGSVLWRCFGVRSQAEIFRHVWKFPQRHLLLDVALAVCPLNFSGVAEDACTVYISSILPHVAGLLDVAQDESCNAVVKCAELRARLSAITSKPTVQLEAFSQAVAASISAAHLRSLLSAASPLSANALVHFLSSLRTADGNANFDALFWASTAAPAETPTACRPLWLVLQAAAFFVRNRLKSPFGSASSSLHFLEMLLVEASSTVGASLQSYLQALSETVAANRAGSRGSPAEFKIHRHSFQPLACVQLVHALEQLILLAQEPVHIQYARLQAQFHSKQTCQFFDANRRVCGDWFQRMRGVSRQTLARYGSHPAHYMVSLARMADLLRQLVPSTSSSPLSQRVLVECAPKGRLKNDGARDLATGTHPGGLLSGAAWTKMSEAGEIFRPLGVESSLVPLLTSAIGLRNVGLCQGVFALQGHAAYALSGTALSLCQDAFLAFASQNYEEAAALFSMHMGVKGQLARSAKASTSQEASERARGNESSGSRALQALIARTWLDSAMWSQNLEEVEHWMLTYESSSCVSPAMIAFATSYACLLKRDYAGCDKAIGATMEAAINDCAPAEAATDRPTSHHMQSSVCRLSRWTDLSSMFLVEASMAARTPAEDSQRTLRAVRDARACLLADISARTYFEPCLGLDTCEPYSVPLQLFAHLEGAAGDKPKIGEQQKLQQDLPLSAANLHSAAVFDFPALGGEADRLRLVQHCVRTKNLVLASRLLDAVGPAMHDTDISSHVVQIAMHRSAILEAKQQLPQAFCILHRKLLTVLRVASKKQALADGSAMSWLGQELLSHTSAETLLGPELRERSSLLFARYCKLLGTRGSDLGSQWSAQGVSGYRSLREALLEIHGVVCELQDGLNGSVGTGGPFSEVCLKRWRAAVWGQGAVDQQSLLPEPLLPASGAQHHSGNTINPQFLGWLSLQSCLICPSSGKLWSRYGDWLFTQRSSLDVQHIEKIAAPVIEPNVIEARASTLHEEFRVLCRVAREAANQWMRGAGRHSASSPGARKAPLSVEMLSDRMKARSCGLWSALGPQAQLQFVLALMELCNCLSEWRPAAMMECLTAYVRHLSIQDAAAADPKTQRTLMRVLRLLTQLEETTSDSVRDLLFISEDTQTSSRLPIGLWEPLIPQLLAYMRHPSKNASTIARYLFTSVARSKPHLAVFPALTAESPGGVGDSHIETTKSIAAPSPLQIVRGLHPEILQGSETFARLLNMMATPVDEICQRLLQYAENFLVCKSGHEAIDCMATVLGSFSSLLTTLDAASGEDRCGGVSPEQAPDSPNNKETSVSELAGPDGAEMLRLMGVQPCLHTVYARRFLNMFLPCLRKAIYLHRPHVLVPLTDASVAQLRSSLLSHIRSLLRTCGHFSRVASVSLQDLAPGIVQLFEGGPSTGQQDPAVAVPEVSLPIRASAETGLDLLRVCRVSPKVHLLSTKTKPKKLEVQAHDGICHTFLLKGRDDLRLDGRIMQLLQTINSIIASDQSSTLVAARGPLVTSSSEVPLRCRDYDVVPIAPRAGLIRWVSAVPLFSIHKQRRLFMQEQQPERSAEDKKRVMESSTDVWHKKVQQHLQSMNVNPATTPRKSWPLEILRKTYADMQADSPADLISRELFLSSLHPAQHFTRCMAYTNSVALTSVIGHLIGLGDRHLDNLLLDLATGEVVHVDYSICFDRGSRLKVPERVPFRLTRCMLSALGPMGVAGLFLQTMEVGLGLLREWRELVLSLIEPCFLFSPLNDWSFPVCTPFKASQASGSMIRRLCQSLTEEVPEANSSAVIDDATRVAGCLEKFTQQSDIVCDAQTRHAGLKVHMSKEVEVLIDLGNRKSKALAESKEVERQLEDLVSEESDVMFALDMKISELQISATGTVAGMLDGQRRAAYALLEQTSEMLFNKDDVLLVDTCREMLSRDAMRGTPDAAHVAKAAREALQSLKKLQKGPGGLTDAPSPGLPGDLRESMLWCLLLHAPCKMYVDELCSFGFLHVTEAWWPPLPKSGTEAHSVLAEFPALGSNSEGGIMTVPGSVENLQGLLPNWRPENAGESIRQMLRKEAETADIGQRLEDWICADGAIGGARSNEFTHAHAEGKEVLQEDTQKFLRTQGLGAFGARVAGLQKKKSGGLLLACLRETADIFEESTAVCRKKVSEFGFSAWISQALDQGYTGPSAPPTKLSANSQLLGLPTHAQFAVLCGRASQIVRLLQQVNLLDLGNGLSVLVHRWQDVAESLAGLEAATVAASATRLHFVDLVSQLPNTQQTVQVSEQEEESTAAPGTAEESGGPPEQWPSLEMSTKAKKAKGKKSSAKHQADLLASMEKLCQELHSLQTKLRTGLHPSTPSPRRCATLLGLPKIRSYRKWLDALLQLREHGERLAAEAEQLKGNFSSDGTGQRLADEVSALHARCGTLTSQIDGLLHVKEGQQSLSLAREMRNFGQEIREAVTILGEVSDSVRTSGPAARARPAWGSKDLDETPHEGLFTPGLLPEQICVALRAATVATVDSASLGEDSAESALSIPACRGPVQKHMVDLMFVRTEIELLLSIFTKPETPTLVVAGLELSRFTSYALFPCFMQVVSILFSFLLEQFHSLQDLGTVRPLEPSFMGILAGVSVIVSEPNGPQDISPLCTRQAHLSMLSRRHRLMQGIATSAKATMTQARSQLKLLQWCHMGSFLTFEVLYQNSVHGSAPTDVRELMEFNSLATFEVAGAVTGVSREGVNLILELFGAHSRLQQSLAEVHAASPEFQSQEVADLLQFVSDSLRIFTGGLRGQSEQILRSTDQAWIRAASGALDMVLDVRARQAEKKGRLREIRVTLDSLGDKDAMGAFGNEAMLAKTLQEISVEGEKLESIQKRAQEELDAFLEKHRKFFGLAMGLAQPSLDGNADALKSYAAGVVGPMTYYRKVVGNKKDLKDASSRNSSAAAAALRDIGMLPSSVTGLLQQCRQWLRCGSTTKATGQPSTKPSTPSGVTVLSFPAPPTDAPPPPPPMDPPPPQVASSTNGPVTKELDDGDRVTTEAGSSFLSEEDEESSQNEEEGAANEEELLATQEEAAARSEATQEEQLAQLAQDKEEVEEPLQRHIANPTLSLEINASFEEEEGSDEGASEKVEAEAAWKAQALYAVKSISRKIPKSSARLDLHAEALIAAATNPDDLAQMYEGWTAWI